MTFHATESYPFGHIAMSCFSSPSLENLLVVERLACTPDLPDGMAVDVSSAYRIEFAATFPLHDFSFDFTRTEHEPKGDPNPGECLEAQSWSIGDGLLMFGTEDGESLQTRMPWLRIDGGNCPVEYLANGFRIAIPYIEPKTNVGFHFILAYNQVDANCDAEWFTVDIPHAKLTDFPIKNRLAGPDAG